MQTYKGKPVEHLGDGVYALYDSLGIWLHANDHKNPTDKIYLEPSVLRNLNRFAKYCENEDTKTFTDHNNKAIINKLEESKDAD